MIELALNSFGFWITVLVVSLINSIAYRGAKETSEAKAYQWLHTLIKSYGVIIPPKAEVERKKLVDHAVSEAKKYNRISVISALVSFVAMFGALVTY